MSEKTQFVFVIGFLVLIFGAYFGALALVGYYDKRERQKRGEPPRFDERQRIARQRAGCHALYALIVFLVLWVILDQLGCAWLGNRWSMLFCALSLAWGVWTADCILHDGFIGWKEKGNSNVFALTWATALFMNLSRTSWLTNSKLPVIFAAAVELALGGVIFYQYRLEKHAEKEDEEL